MTEIKPATLKQGMPKAERNGMFGNEVLLIERAKAGQPVVAIVTFTVPRVMHDEVADERYPVLQMAAIEPMLTDDSEASAVQLRDAEYKARTGVDTLDLPDIDDEEDA